MIIGICGQAGSGKDTAADFFVKHAGFVKVAFADPMKRICQDVFDFTDEQLWGPSECRNAPDPRYIRNAGFLDENGDPASEFLTPRFALQQLGSEWGRNCYQDTWVRYALRVHEKLQTGEYYYDVKTGLRALVGVGSFDQHGQEMVRPKTNVVISDVRFKNEIDAIKGAGGKVIRMLRGKGLEGAAGQHGSETEQAGIPLDYFDLVVDNRTWTLDHLETFIRETAAMWKQYPTPQGVKHDRE
jgi:hypothetical protein